MGLRNDLVNQISKNLRIFKYNDEEESQFLNRLLYSAIAAWVIQPTRDEDFRYNYNKKGVSKSYITRKISKIVSEFIAIFPSFKVFLDGITEGEFVKEIREFYERAGYIVPVGFDEFVTTSPIKAVRINKSWLLVRNDFESICKKSVGLGLFIEDSSDEKVTSLENLFYLPNLDAQKWTTKYVKNLKWINSAKIGLDARFFDIRSMKSFSGCWIDKFPENCEITLYKTNNWDYGFARKNSTGIVGLKIPDWLIGQGNNESEKLFDNDVRRFMYGLKAMNNNNANAIADKKLGYFELKLFNALPTRELTTLQFLGWRKRGIYDETNYIIPDETFETVKSLLERLSILVEVREI